jgi:hypothetical protein
VGFYVKEKAVEHAAEVQKLRMRGSVDSTDLLDQLFYAWQFLAQVAVVRGDNVVDEIGERAGSPIHGRPGRLLIACAQLSYDLIAVKPFLHAGTIQSLSAAAAIVNAKSVEYAGSLGLRRDDLAYGP